MNKLVISLAVVASVLSTSAFAQNAIGVGTGISNSRSNSAAVADPVQNNRNTALSASQSNSASRSNSNVNSRINSAQSTAVRSVNANQSGAANTNNFNSTTTGQSPAVFAPGMSAAGIESCNGSVSLGGAAVGGGGALGFPWQDGPCNKRLNARTLWAFGQRDAAIQVMCQDDEVASALVASGVRCRIGRYAVQTVAYTESYGHPVFKGEYHGPVPGEKSQPVALDMKRSASYFDKKGHQYVVAACGTKGARQSADAGVCVKTASN
jgi:hypothetical protein